MKRHFNIFLASSLAGSLLILSGCAQPWPKRATGGLAERDLPYSVVHADAAEAILNNRSSRKIAPARLAEAEDHLILAIRERAAGLCADSEENTFAVSNALGPVPNHRQPIEQLENAGPCDAYAGDQQ